jgi:8-oxo-dGTP pyrophosphatase MutT (NUDIX family)
MPFDDHEYPQIIPTPAHVRPGDVAPWHHLDPSERQHVSLERVEQALRSNARHFDDSWPPEQPAELSGVVADSEPRPITRRSAVLVALFEENGEARILLTRRSVDLKNHRGEVALPGGRCDEGETSSEAALREASEEIGLNTSAVRVVGWLSPIVTYASGSAIQPIVGLLEQRPSLVANPREVERIFDVGLSELMAEGNFIEQRWRREVPRPGAEADGSFPIYFYRVPGEVVWGATARVLTELLAVVTGTQHSMPRWVIG